jgi:hypothetical protein
MMAAELEWDFIGEGQKIALCKGGKGAACKIARAAALLQAAP